MSHESNNSLSLTVPASIIEHIAERAAEIVVARLPHAASVSRYLTVGEAAEYLRCKPQRVYDLLSAGRLTRHKDGSRVLVSRSELHAHVGEGGPDRIVPRLSPTAQTRSAKELSG